ncbi:hypothetical protein [Leucobacter chromiiresistens]|uniref:Uncharacterized protein n=1 Tax=Leucobacter chromiiresistens TaxID=1079994 RepID=A0A1H1A0V0_9MICO|nr:hypothetical protein [Leucobacter chromiiresistens]SDQ33262.1 hypothetical protein SAMN04488565_2236 [Leucobacter chromiiresistens]
MELTNLTHNQLRGLIDDAGLSWTYDRDGGFKIRLKSAATGYFDALRLEIQPDLSVRGEFLNADIVKEGQGLTLSFPSAEAEGNVSPAYKTVELFLTPKPYGVEFQLYARAELTDKPMHVRVIPGAEQRAVVTEWCDIIERDGEAWLMGTVAGTPDFQNLVRKLFRLGHSMFGGTITGLMAVNEDSVPEEWAEPKTQQPRLSSSLPSPSSDEGDRRKSWWQRKKIRK